METEYKDIVIIGAGIIGCATAYYLSKIRSDIILLEENIPGSGASGACNGGLSILGKKGELLNQSIVSLKLYKKLQKELSYPEFKIDQTRSIIIIAENKKQMVKVKNLASKLKNKELGVQILDQKELEKYLPKLKKDIEGAAIAAGGIQGYVNPFKALEAFLTGFSKNGGRLSKREKVEKILQKGKKVIGVKTNQRIIKSNVVVMCAGHKSNKLLQQLEIPADISSNKGTVLVTEKMNWPLKSNILFAGFLEDKVPVNLVLEKTLEENLLIGSSSQYNNPSKKIDLEIVNKIAGKAIQMFPFLKGTKIIRVFTGIRPHKDTPFIGEIPRIKGLYAAYGHGSMGITLAPYTGKTLANLIK